MIYVHHIGQALRVSALIELVGDETRTLLDRRYPDKGPALDSEANGVPVVCAIDSGVITGIGYEQLVEEGRRGTACWKSFRPSATSCPPAAPSSESMELHCRG